MSEGYKIASGYNVALGSLVDIETITPSSDEPFAGPQVIALYDDGLLAVRGDGLITIRGFASVTWRFGRMTYAQYAYLKATYCGGGLSGLVTILTALGSATKVRMNAAMTLKKPVDLHAEVWYRAPIDVVFTKLETAA